MTIERPLRGPSRSTPYAELPEFLTPEEFRVYLSLGRNTVYDLLRRGEVPHSRYGRIIRIPKTAVHPLTVK
jgi:excisionase family DNA binding protein